ncbi:unnamed protein product [Paramecium primaurelia]|uniref:Uncharacterized protein n=1 Tax=Paramecium primaurelia TaxID=5886 RepID=A0A8S1PPK7_PARPR|nr:unnamed protein product [Paramecium primaurelia]
MNLEIPQHAFMASKNQRKPYQMHCLISSQPYSFSQLIFENSICEANSSVSTTKRYSKQNQVTSYFYIFQLKLYCIQRQKTYTLKKQLILIYIDLNSTYKTQQKIISSNHQFKYFPFKKGNLYPFRNRIKKSQKSIQTFDQYIDESYDRVNGAIDSIYEQMYLKPAPEQKKDQRTSTEVLKLPDAPQLKIKMIINITPDETKSFRCLQQQKVQVVVQEEHEVFERQEDLGQILANANQIIIDDDDSSSIFKKLLDMLKKEQIKDCVAYLQSFKYQEQKEKEQMKKIIHILKNIKDHEFNQKDYSSEAFEEIKKDLIKKLQGNKSMIELLKFLVMLTSIDDLIWIQFISLIGLDEGRSQKQII